MTDHCSQQAASSSAPQSPPWTRKHRPPHGCHYRLPSKPTQCQICSNSPQPRESRVFRHSTLHTAREQMGPRPKHFTSCCYTSHGRLKDIFTAASANIGGDERHPHAGATCPVFPQVCEKRKRSHQLGTLCIHALKPAYKMYHDLQQDSR